MKDHRKFVIKFYGYDKYNQPEIDIQEVEHHWVIKVGHHSTNHKDDGHLVYGMDVQTVTPLFDDEIETLMEGLRLARELANGTITIEVPDDGGWRDTSDISGNPRRSKS